MAKPTTSYAVGGQVAARRPGNERLMPTRQEVRGRAQAVRNSQTFGRLLGQAVARCGAARSVAEACSSEHSRCPSRSIDCRCECDVMQSW